MQSWLEGRNWVGKCAQATGMPTSLRILSSKADSNTWESFTRSGLKQESVHQDSLCSDIFRKRATKPLLKQKHRQKHLTWAKEKKNWTVAQWSKLQCPLFRWKSILHFIWKSSSQSLEEERRSTESKLLEVQREVSTVSDYLGCHVICWCWSTVFSEVHSQLSHLPGHFRELHASFCWQALWRCWFHFPARLGTCPHCQRHQTLVQWQCVTVLDWPANSPDLNPIENLWGIVKRTMTDTRPNNADDLKAAIKAIWASITPELCHRLIASMPRRADAVIHAKGGPTKYWVHRNEHTFQKPDISV